MISSVAPNVTVTLVTVTYGDRWKLLVQALTSAFREGAARAIVVNNGGRGAIGERCAEAFGRRVRVVEHARNMGSAPGFRAGIEAARSDGAELVLLLDDDNRLEPGCLKKLVAAYRTALAKNPAQPMAVVGFRPENQTDISAGRARQELYLNAFFGFHLKHLPTKLWRRWRARWRHEPSRPIPDLGVLDFAPYSGMLFHASLIDVIGLPDPSFVLYADDTEFSYRVTRMGGVLLVVTAGRVADIEPSWNIKRLHKTALDAWLTGGSDLSVFYAARNRACFERHSVAHGTGLTRALNRFAFLLALRLRALQIRRMDRYRLFHAAIMDGEKRRLGVKPGFELP